MIAEHGRMLCLVYSEAVECMTSAESKNRNKTSLQPLRGLTTATGIDQLATAVLLLPERQSFSSH